jgi:hypothetical protein
MTNKKADKHFLEAALMNVETVVDVFTENSAIAAIPIIGTAVKLCKGYDDLRSLAFAAKLAKFIDEPDLRTDVAAEKIKQKIADNPDEAIKVGETLFFVLDRFIDLDKPKVLAKGYVAYLNDIVSVEELQRFAQAIDIAFAADLHRFLSNELDEYEDTRPWMLSLVPSGLTLAHVRPMPPSKTFYDPSPVGRALWRAWHFRPQ